MAVKVHSLDPASAAVRRERIRRRAIQLRRQRTKARNGTKAGRQRVHSSEAERARRVRELRKAAGLCTQCGKARGNGRKHMSTCAVCSGSKNPIKTKCGICGELGHTRRRCQKGTECRPR